MVLPGYETTGNLGKGKLLWGWRESGGKENGTNDIIVNM
jgi:hypothetical protein